MRDLMKALDTNIIIYHAVKDSRLGKNASEIIARVEKGEEIFIPLAVFKEFMFDMLARGKDIPYILETFALFQKDNVKIAEDDFGIFIQGLQMAHQYKIGPTDGVIAATMLNHGITEIYSNDPDFDKVPGIKRIF